MAEDMRYMNVPPKNIRRRRLIIFIPIIVIVVFFYLIGYKANATRRQTSNFASNTNAIAAQSNFLGTQFRAAINAKSKTKFLSESLENMVSQALTHSQRAEDIDPPDDLRLAHSFFVVAMKLRHQGLEKYSRKVLTSLSQKDLNKASDEAVKDIALSDASYSYFLQEASRYLSANDLRISLKSSNFLTIKAKKRIVALKIKKPAKKEKKKKEEVIESDLAILDVATRPLRISYNPANDIRVLPDTNTVNVRVEIENKGKEDEEDIPVEIELFNDDKSIDKKDDVISKIAAGKKRKITLEGFEAQQKGVNVFKIQVGPLTNEKNESDNSYTYKFIFESQD